MDYRSLPRISNSDLTEFRNFIFRHDFIKPVNALSFGSALHEFLLEPADMPKRLLELPEAVNRELLQKLVAQVRADRYCRWALRFSRKETVQLWIDPATGLELKSKLDIVYKGRLVIDIKSTSQRTYADFLKSLTTYDYDRQAAFYLDSIGAKRFVFVGVQKVKPYNIWIVTPSLSFIECGRQKYKALLREWKRREQAGQPFIPSSWSTSNQPELCW